MQPLLFQVRTYLSGAWHYRWVAVAVAWVVCVVGWAAVAFIPNQFDAVAKIYVDTEFVDDTVAERPHGSDGFRAASVRDAEHIADQTQP